MKRLFEIFPVLSLYLQWEQEREDTVRRLAISTNDHLTLALSASQIISGSQLAHLKSRILAQVKIPQSRSSLHVRVSARRDRKEGTERSVRRQGLLGEKYTPRRYRDLRRSSYSSSLSECLLQLHEERHMPEQTPSRSRSPLASSLLSPSLQTLTSQKRFPGRSGMMGNHYQQLLVAFPS